MNLAQQWLPLPRCANYPSFCGKLSIFYSGEYRIMDNHEGPEAYSQTGTSSLPDLWRGSGQEMCELSTGASERAAS